MSSIAAELRLSVFEFSLLLFWSLGRASALLLTVNVTLKTFGTARFLRENGRMDVKWLYITFGDL